MIKRYPEDVVKDTGTIGITLPTNTLDKRTGLISTSRTTEQQAVSNYINLLLTFPGERYMQPTYGIGIQRYLFEPNTEGTRNDIEFAIRTQSAFWLPYIVNHNIDVRGRSDIPGLNSDPENAIQIIITFSVLEQGANQTIVLFSENGQVNYRFQ